MKLYIITKKKVVLQGNTIFLFKIIVLKYYLNRGDIMSKIELVNAYKRTTENEIRKDNYFFERF